MFKKRKKEKSSSSNISNPYIDGRREWNERYGSYIKRAQAWRAVAFLSLTMAIISSLGLVYVSSKSQIVPYIVKIDKIGKVTGVGIATGGGKVDTNIIKYTLAEFIKNFRTVYPDPTVQADYVYKMYRYLSDSLPAKSQVDRYMSEHSPFMRAYDGKVEIEVESILNVSRDTWQINWSELEYNKEGLFKKSKRYRGILTIVFDSPKTEAEVLKNPIGLYIKEISWSEILKGIK